MQKVMLNQHQFHIQANHIILEQFQFNTQKKSLWKKIKKIIMLRNLALILLIFFHEF